MGGLTPQPEQMKFGALKKGRFFFDFSGVICELGRCWDFKVDLVGSLVDHEGRENYWHRRVANRRVASGTPIKSRMNFVLKENLMFLALFSSFLLIVAVLLIKNASLLLFFRHQR